MASKELVDNILSFDPLGDAEGRFGENTDEAMAAGLVNLHMRRAAMEAAMQENRDTYRNMPYHEYLAVVESIGFECVYSEDFIVRSAGDHNYRKENHRIYWKRDEGLVLVLNSYTSCGREPSINRATLYYNVELVPEWHKQPWAFSGGTGCRFDFDDFDSPCEVWKGDSHVEDALKHKIEKLRDLGKLMPEWYEVDFLHFGHYGARDVKERNYNGWRDNPPDLHSEWREYNERLPEDLRNMINQAIDRDETNRVLYKEALKRHREKTKEQKNANQQPIR